MKETISLILIITLCMTALAGCAVKKPESVATTSAPGQTQENEPQSGELLPISYIGMTVESIGEILNEQGTYRCADGGSYTVFDDGEMRNPIGVSNHADVTTSDLRVKTVYVITPGAQLEQGVSTGQTYAQYQKNPDINDLTDLRFNKKVFSYSCTYQTEADGQKVTVWLFFDSPDSVCSSAMITTMFYDLPPLSDTPDNPPEFLLQTVGKSTLSAQSKYGDGLLIHSDFSDKLYSVLTYNESRDIMPGIDYWNKVKAVQMYSPSEYEILPGFVFGKTYGEYVEGGFTFFGDEYYDEDAACKATPVCLRIGALNLEGVVHYNDDDVMQSCSFICKQMAF